MKIEVTDIRNSLKLKSPDHLDMQVINFVKSNFCKRPIDIPGQPGKYESYALKYMTDMFMEKNPNLIHRYGLTYRNIDKWFDIKLLPDIKPGQMNMSFESFFYKF